VVSQCVPSEGNSAQDPSLHERYLVSTVIWSIRLPDSHFDLLAVTLVSQYFHHRRTIRISHVYLVTLTVCHALRPRRCLIYLPINGIWDSAFGFCDTLSHLRFRTLTGLDHFSHMAYGLQSPCLRLTYAVTDAGPKLGMECAGSSLFQSHFQRPATRHLVAHRKSIQEVIEPSFCKSSKATSPWSAFWLEYGL
jgi:hypothetical protein